MNTAMKKNDIGSDGKIIPGKDVKGRKFNAISSKCTIS